MAMTADYCTIPSQLSVTDVYESATSVIKSKASLKSSSSLLNSCRICLSSIFHPAILTCGHKFCEKCLNKYWHVTEKPDFIVCPLCRTSVYNVSFSPKSETSTQDFRKTFDSNLQTSGPHNDIMTINSLLLLMVFFLLPVFYYMSIALRPPLLKLLNLFTNLFYTFVYMI